MKFFSWKDFERFLMIKKDEWEKRIVSFEVTPDCIYVYPKTDTTDNDIYNIFQQLFPTNYDDEHLLKLNIETNPISIFIDRELDEIEGLDVIPLFKKILYRSSVYPTEKLKPLTCPVIAFHSYKGGVGRTLSLLAFAKAWSNVFEDDPKKNRLLIVDADIEAPGLTWLNQKGNNDVFSYLDLLEIIQDHRDFEDIMSVVKNLIGDSTITVDTSKTKTEHVFLPTYRYREQLLDIYASPESIVGRKNKRYILAETLAEIGKSVGVGAVLVDLRAGISEFSSTLLFDKRVKKYIVTSTSTQSLRGTKFILDYLLKGINVENDSLLPEVFLSMIPDDLRGSSEIVDIKNNILAHYDCVANINEETDLTDNILTDMPFASELLHLTSLTQIFNKLTDRELFRKMIQLVKENYVEQDDHLNNKVIEEKTRSNLLCKLHDIANNQITADANATTLGLLMTDPLKNLITIYKSTLPTTVIMGAKGAGKTFLYKKMIEEKNWKSFCNNLHQNVNQTGMDAPIFPILSSTSFTHDLLKKCIREINDTVDFIKINEAVYDYNSDFLKKQKGNNHTEVEWVDIWKKVLLKSFNNTFSSLKEIDDVLRSKNKNIIFLLDGVEEIFNDVVASKSEQDAVVALCRDLVNTIEARFTNLGIIVFMRHDMIQNSLAVNIAQFEQKYEQVRLRWTGEDALRLVVWLAKQSVDDFYKEVIPIEKASTEVIANYLNKIWGVKLGKSTSNEAYTSRWVLAALSDFYGQLQARDMIRFLKYATQNTQPKVFYADRYIMPAEIRRAVANCSSEKIGEVKQEYPMLRDVLERMNNSPEDSKKLPFTKDEIELSAQEEKSMKQVGFLQNQGDDYYIPEIVRHGLNFKYKKGARPKVLSLLLRQN